MPSTKKLNTLIPNGGFNRSQRSHFLGRTDFYDLLNMRPWIGSLEQTSAFKQEFAMTVLTGESATTQIHLLTLVTVGTAIKYLIMNDKNARLVTPTSTSTQTLVPIILPVIIPRPATSNFSSILLQGTTDLLADFTADGDLITVKAVSSTQIQWKKNSGSFSSSITVTNNTAVLTGSSGLTIYFPGSAAVVLTTNDLWSWQRFDNSAIGFAPTQLQTYQSFGYRTDIYVVGHGAPILRLRNTTFETVGYGQVYGKYAIFYQNHLVVAQFHIPIAGNVGQVTEVNDPSLTPFTLGWSDLNNPDNFLATDTNEADTYVLPYSSNTENLALGITGMGLLRDLLVIYLTTDFYEMNYVGLPRVMQILPKNAGVGSYFPSGLVVTPRGHYFLSRDNAYFYDGTTPQPIGEPVREKLFGEMVGPTDSYRNKLWGYYDTARQEVIWTYFILLGGTYYQSRQVVYQEKYQRWYFRNIPSHHSDGGVGDILASCRRYNDLNGLLYGDINVYGDVAEAAISPTVIKDAVDGTGATSYTQPLVETNDLIYTDLFYIKELDTFYIDASWSNDAAGMQGIQLQYQMRNYLTSQFAPIFTTLANYWTLSLPERRLGLPRDSGVIARFRLIFTGTTPLDCKLFGYGDFVYGEGREIERDW